jgi:D-tyrosyl-tRNA(Tyr) deacylase
MAAEIRSEKTLFYSAEEWRASTDTKLLVTTYIHTLKEIDRDFGAFFSVHA